MEMNGDEFDFTIDFTTILSYLKELKQFRNQFNFEKYYRQGKVLKSKNCNS